MLVLVLVLVLMLKKSMVWKEEKKIEHSDYGQQEGSNENIVGHVLLRINYIIVI